MFQTDDANLLSSLWFCSWWFDFKDYFPITLIKTEGLNPDGKYIFGYHPHGIISFGAFSTFGTDGCGFGDLFPGIRVHLVNRWLRRYLEFFSAECTDCI
jgi:hypothetical protein